MERESDSGEVMPAESEKKVRRRLVQRNYRQRHLERIKKSEAEKRIEVKLKVMRLYGCACVGCGINELAVLTLDHVNDDGAYKRKDVDSTGITFYARLIRAERRKDIQVLCMSCQYRKRNYGADMSEWNAQKTMARCR